MYNEDPGSRHYIKETKPTRHVLSECRALDHRRQEVYFVEKNMTNYCILYMECVGMETQKAHEAPVLL